MSSERLLIRLHRLRRREPDQEAKESIAIGINWVYKHENCLVSVHFDPLIGKKFAGQGGPECANGSALRTKRSSVPQLDPK